MSAERVLFSEPVQFKGEPGLCRAVATAARQARTSSAEWMRRALREKLAAEGVAHLLASRDARANAGQSVDLVADMKRRHGIAA